MACKKDNCACKDTTNSASHSPGVSKPSKIMQILPVNLDVVTLLVKKLDNFVALPEYKTEGAAAMDLYATEDKGIEENTVYAIPTGIAVAIPPGYEAQIRARSGNALRGLIVVNGPGTIDSDYRGEIKVLLATVTGFCQIAKGDRIAQMVIAPVTRANLRVVTDLDETIRGIGGFGSTDVVNF